MIASSPINQSIEIILSGFMLLLRKHICIYILVCIFITATNNSTAQEICNNGKDDDGNELIDLEDPACQCRFTVNGNLLQNASFESFDHCPVNFIYDEDYNIADQWQLGTYTNINEAYYYHNLQCIYDSSLFMSRMPPKLPLPNGNAFIGIQDIYSFIDSVKDNELTKSYIGQCLQSPLKKEKHIL